jgi:hypothetical protein
MRKLAVLLSAALMVSVPLVATMTTDTYAAAKKAKKAAKVAKVAPAPKDTGPQAPFQSMYNAVSDLGGQLVTYRYDPNAPAKKK